MFVLQRRTVPAFNLASAKGQRTGDQFGLLRTAFLLAFEVCRLFVLILDVHVDVQTKQLTAVPTISVQLTKALADQR